MIARGSPDLLLTLFSFFLGSGLEPFIEKGGEDRKAHWKWSTKTFHSRPKLTGVSILIVPFLIVFISIFIEADGPRGIFCCLLALQPSQSSRIELRSVVQKRPSKGGLAPKVTQWVQVKQVRR